MFAALIKFSIYFILPLSVAIYFYFKKKFSYFKDLKIPHSKPKWPMGNLGGSGTTCHMAEVLMRVYEENKGKDVICGFYSFLQPVYMVMDEEVVKSVLIKDFNNFVNRGMYINEEDEPLSGNMFLLEDDRWRFIRNKLSPVFTSGKLKAMFPIITQNARNLITSLNKHDQKSVELKDITNRYTIDVISTVAFGMDANTLNGDHPRLYRVFLDMAENGGIQLLKFFLATVFPNFAKKIHIQLMKKSVSEFFTEVVSSNIKYREEMKDNRKDFLNMLIQLKNKGSIEGEISSDVKKLTLNEILAEAFVFFFAGSDTSSSAIAFALTELSRDQEVQEKLRKEIEEKSSNGEITYEALHEMKYLGQVVDETLRMYTTGFIQLRKASNDYKVPNSSHIIPKGSAVWIPAVGFHYDERYWPNPRKFDPERFTQEEIEKRSPYVYLPFGEGPRNCIGMRFALLNVKLAVATVIKNFKLTMDSRTIYPFKLNPQHPHMDIACGHWLKLEKI